MDLERAFLDDMVAQPHDRTPWLIFADWLEERGDRRGELVRLLRLCWDEPRKRAFKERHARLQELFAVGVRLPLPRYTNTLGMEFVWVPPGEFWMGGDGKPGKKRVAMPEPFYLGVHPVTQGQWQALMGNQPSGFSRAGGEKDSVQDLADVDLNQLPVEQVSWDDVQKFLVALNTKEGGSGWTCRLPTEEEWEYAARSPVTCRADCAFSFHAGQPSNSLSSEQANFNGNYPADAPAGPYLGRTTKVGSYPPNRLGIHDLHGNVWEWTDTPEGLNRVCRGGSWFFGGSYCTAAYRDTFAQECRSSDLGFRLARVPSGG